MLTFWDAQPRLEAENKVQKARFGNFIVGTLYLSAFTLTAEVRQVLSQADAPESVVRAALISLAQLSGKATQTEIARFASTDQSAMIQAAAIRAVSEFDVTSAAKLAAPLVAASREESLTSRLLGPLRKCASVL